MGAVHSLSSVISVSHYYYLGTDAQDQLTTLQHEENIYKICGEDLLQRKQAMTKLLSEVERMMMVND